MGVQNCFAAASVFALTTFSTGSALACNDFENVFFSCRGGGAGGNVLKAVTPKSFHGVITEVDKTVGPTAAVVIKGKVVAAVPPLAVILAGAELIREVPVGHGGFFAPGATDAASSTSSQPEIVSSANTCVTREGTFSISYTVPGSMCTAHTPYGSFPGYAN